MVPVVLSGVKSGGRKRSQLFDQFNPSSLNRAVSRLEEAVDKALPSPRPNFEFQGVSYEDNPTDKTELVKLLEEMPNDHMLTVPGHPDLKVTAGSELGHRIKIEAFLWAKHGHSTEAIANAMKAIDYERELKFAIEAFQEEGTTERVSATVRKTTEPAGPRKAKQSRPWRGSRK